ncbi:MAG: hypothetical protein BJ554DRAFT_700 [Olpidium bornovanus]|uniref:Uncharacterized protein n=1 Tax=Olpidium bornovanus TaxID=278681 RepID=A0A8H7ZTE4_9FUNG|nr:MAG: hypothetical protein BJ554DRAFT_700 [Olpidium bornovanus]
MYTLFTSQTMLGFRNRIRHLLLLDYRTVVCFLLITW